MNKSCDLGLSTVKYSNSSTLICFLPVFVYYWGVYGILYGISLPSHGTHEFKKFNNRVGIRAGGGGWKFLEKLIIGRGTIIRHSRVIGKRKKAAQHH